MPRVRRYSNSVNNNLEIRTLDLLNHSEEAMSIQQLQQGDIVLSHYTSQKLARVLGKLVDMGFVKKSKSKSSNHMMYKSVSVMLAQGYKIEDEVIPAVDPIATMPMMSNWEIITERMPEE